MKYLEQLKVVITIIVKDLEYFKTQPDPVSFILHDT